jgi:hypothetical protein
MQKQSTRVTVIVELLVAMSTALALAGCTGGSGTPLQSAGPGVSATPTADAATPAATTTAAPSATPSSAHPSATPVFSTTYTSDDEQIAALIRAGVDEAVPQLRLLNDSDPSELQELFGPMGEWISSQVTGVAAYTPSSCTSTAVALFLDGMAQYDAIRKQFLAWRDWGAHGHAFPPAAPPQAAKTLEAAVVELTAQCTA